MIFREAHDVPHGGLTALLGRINLPVAEQVLDVVGVLASDALLPASDSCIQDYR